ncbi:MAG: iron chelate uptake ABC transporter family permease subunit, partial [Nocardioides sp.]|uniref:iron chelate uptake ABC transporter family permease subunit n=1 Tax=Nocardioides sp. TaxID=35761 RepID=UPI0039E68185
MVTLRLAGLSIRFRRRTAAALVLLALAVLVAAVVGLMVGDYGLGPGAVWRALTGSADDPLAAYFVRELRAPRVVAALAVGAALG